MAVAELEHVSPRLSLHNTPNGRFGDAKLLSNRLLRQPAAIIECTNPSDLLLSQIRLIGAFAPRSRLRFRPRSGPHAACGSSLPVPIEAILSTSTEEQMGRINAEFHVAPVAHTQPGRYRSMRDLVRCPVGKQRAGTAVGKPAVSVLALCPGPQPTRVRAARPICVQPQLLGWRDVARVFRTRCARLCTHLDLLCRGATLPAVPTAREHFYCAAIVRLRQCEWQ